MRRRLAKAADAMTEFSLAYVGENPVRSCIYLFVGELTIWMLVLGGGFIAFSALVSAVRW